MSAGTGQVTAEQISEIQDQVAEDMAAMAEQLKHSSLRMRDLVTSDSKVGGMGCALFQLSQLLALCCVARCFIAWLGYRRDRTQVGVFARCLSFFRSCDVMCAEADH